MRIGVDTNLLAYAEGVDGDVKRIQARAVMGRLAGHQVVVPGQVLGELYNVLTRKGGRSGLAARLDVDLWRTTLDAVYADDQVMAEALTLAAAHRFQIWDALILATAAAAGCVLLLSEDMQDGFVWSGMTIVNPFASPLNPAAAALLGGP